MNKPQPMMVSLGFTTGKVPEGTHICQIYTDDDERDQSILQFLLSGVEGGERAACFSEKMDSATLSGYFSQNGLNFEDACGHSGCLLSRTREVYFEGDRFDPDRMISLLTRFYHEALAAGYPAARVIGEMLPEIKTIAGGERLLEYESRVSILLRDVPVTSVCQYDARVFDGATIMDVLKVHPHMVVGGAVINNPFYTPPETFLSQ